VDDIVDGVVKVLPSVLVERIWRKDLK